VSRADKLLAAGLAGAALAGIVAGLFLRSSGRLDTADWTINPAAGHRSALTAGLVFGALALVLGVVSLGALALRYRRSSWFVTVGGILLVPAGLAGLGLVELDAVLLIKTRKAADLFSDGPAFVLRWGGWSLLAWSTLILCGAAGLISLGFGLGRVRPALEHSGIALAFGGLLLLPLPKLGAPLLALALFWLAFQVLRGSAPVVPAEQPEPSPPPVASPAPDV
jgi:hypothetical protein